MRNGPEFSSLKAYLIPWKLGLHGGLQYYLVLLLFAFVFVFDFVFKKKIET